jgi:hypothetical protein
VGGEVSGGEGRGVILGSFGVRGGFGKGGL